MIGGRTAAATGATAPARQGHPRLAIGAAHVPKAGAVGHRGGMKGTVNQPNPPLRQLCLLKSHFSRKRKGSAR
jgi:hypothetical protein